MIRSGKTPPLRVLGIDPGTNLAGWGLLDLQGNRIDHVDNGVLHLRGRDLAARLGQLFAGLEQVIKEFEPGEVAVEGVFTARNARSALVLGHARGVALLVADRRGLPVFEYAPAKVKKSVSGSGRAAKDQMQRAVQLLCSLPEQAQEDASDALAVAYCHAVRRPAGAALARSAR